MGRNESDTGFKGRDAMANIANDDLFSSDTDKNL
jgi:hypothetical protein